MIFQSLFKTVVSLQSDREPNVRMISSDKVGTVGGEISVFVEGFVCEISVGKCI